MTRLTAFRTTVTTLAGMAAVLLLGVIVGEYELSPKVSGQLTDAIVYVCLGQAARSTAEVWAAPKKAA